VEVLSEETRQQAISPLLALPVAPGWRRVDAEHCHVILHPFPYPQIVSARLDLPVTKLTDAIEEAREVVRAHGRGILVWITRPELPWLDDELARCGLKNEDSNGFEAVENAMVLIQAPDGDGGDAVDVVAVESFAEFAAGTRVENAAFEMPEADCAEVEAGLEERWTEYTTANSPYRRWNAYLDGRAIGAASGVLGPGGLNLFGGGVLPDARSRGVYRALVKARWEHAVELGTPALTVQAGRMSMPVLERLGFQWIASMRTYVDQFERPAG
jgi:GNAT superfamily N-acetyltransferase